MVYFISDPHIGHRNIARYRPFVDSCEDNTAQFLDQWKKTIRKEKDIVYILGDAAFDYGSLQLFKDLRGRKILIKGNHDDYVKTEHQTEVFEEIYGMLKYKSFWLTHCPIHPEEMRNRRGNIHGHVHLETIMKKQNGPFSFKPAIDKRYFNTCVDVVFPQYGSWFVTLDQIREYFGLTFGAK